MFKTLLHGFCQTIQSIQWSKLCIFPPLQMDRINKSLSSSGLGLSSPLRRKVSSCSACRLRFNSVVGCVLWKTHTVGSLLHTFSDPVFDLLRMNFCVFQRRFCQCCLHEMQRCPFILVLIGLLQSSTFSPVSKKTFNKFTH